VLGFFYSRSVQHFSENVYDPDFSTIFGGVPPEIIFGTPLVDGKYSLSGRGRGADEQVAGFVDATFAITPRLKATAGVRVAHTRFEGNSLFQGPVSGEQLQPQQSVGETPVTPKFALNWQASPRCCSTAQSPRAIGSAGPMRRFPCRRARRSVRVRLFQRARYLQVGQPVEL
jgi:outer membrane receptor protein involved in Fe transport